MAGVVAAIEDGRAVNGTLRGGLGGQRASVGSPVGVVTAAPAGSGCGDHRNGCSCCTCTKRARAARALWTLADATRSPKPAADSNALRGQWCGHVSGRRRFRQQRRGANW